MRGRPSLRRSRARLLRPAGRRACRKHRQLVFVEKLLGDGEAKELLCIGNGDARRRDSSPSGAPALGRKKGSLNRRRAQPTCRSLLLVDLRRVASSLRPLRWKHSIEAFRSGWGGAGAGRGVDRGSTSPAASYWRLQVTATSPPFAQHVARLRERSAARSKGPPKCRCFMELRHGSISYFPVDRVKIAIEFRKTGQFRI